MMDDRLLMLDEQLQEAQILIDDLKQRGYHVVTHLLPVTTFWPAEAYHQNYYHKHQKLPYCHRPEARFDS